VTHSTKRRSAIVTGASRGIGNATAIELAQRGYDVALLARSIERSRQTAAQIESSGGRAVAIECDVGDSKQVRDAVQHTVDTFGRIDVLVNNAGTVDPIGRIADLSDDDFDQTLRINLNGAFYCARACLEVMLAAGSGTIINVSSGAAHRPLEGWASYCASKAGLYMLTRSLHLEEAVNGIRVFGVSPGTVDTEMQSVIRRSGINPISQMQRKQHAPASLPAQAIAALCDSGFDDLLGTDVSIREDSFQARL
jgi:NAD(P)-dependent dehydrogenase (short-subunit alcohol dehydrogenase family)